MSFRVIVFAIASIFLLVGLLFLSIGTSDPAPRETWKTYGGHFASMEIVPTPKMGRLLTLTIQGNDEESRFTLSRVENIPGLEERLGQLSVGETVSVDAVPRDLLAGGWAPRPEDPLYLLVLRQGETVLYDRDHGNIAGVWMPRLTVAAGILMIAFSTLVLLLLLKQFFQRRRGTSWNAAWTL